VIETNIFAISSPFHYSRDAYYTNAKHFSWLEQEDYERILNDNIQIIFMYCEEFFQTPEAKKEWNQALINFKIKAFNDWKAYEKFKEVFIPFMNQALTYYKNNPSETLTFDSIKKNWEEVSQELEIPFKDSMGEIYGFIRKKLRVLEK
jgi:hypothetical protein